MDMLLMIAATQGGGAAPVDNTPIQFIFTDQGAVGTSAVITSNTITLAGMDGGSSAVVSITGGTYSKNGGAYTSSAGTGTLGDTFAVRHTSSASTATATNTVLTVGTISDTFTSTTYSSLGAEMLTNGDMSSATGWTLTPSTGTASISGGTLTINDPNGDSPNALQSIAALTVGWYRVGVTIVSADGNAAAHCRVQLADGQPFNFIGTQSGSFTVDLQVSSVVSKIFRIYGDQTAGAWVFDNASVKPLT